MIRSWSELNVPAPRSLPPHVKLVRNNQGREYYYLTLNRGTKRQGKAIRLPDDPHSPDFWRAYTAALDLPPPRKSANAMRELDKAWGGDPDKDYVAASPEWNELSDITKREWKRYRKRIVAAWGDLEVRGIEPKHVMALRNKWADQPASANNLLRCLSSMLSWSVPMGWRADNPCREVSLLKGGDAYAPWPWKIISAAERQLKHNGREDLWWAVALALYTGQRLGDVLAMKWSDIDGGLIRCRQGKTGKLVQVPLHKSLRQVLSGIPRRQLYILTSTEGTRWKAFQASWRNNKPYLVKRLDLVFHGLRKSAVVFLLEAGATEAETAAVTGQTLAMVAHYAKEVNRGKLAASAILKWERAGT